MELLPDVYRGFKKQPYYFKPHYKFMKKNCNGTFSFIQKMYKVAKCRFLTGLLFVFITSSMSAESSQSPISIELKNTSIKYVLKHIEKNSNYVFYYSDEVKAELSKKIDITSSSQLIDKTLDVVLSSTTLDYMVEGYQVSIFVSKAKTSKKTEVNHSESEENTIKGMVMDAVDNPLPGVSIVIKGTTTGTATDVDGKFTIEAPENSILVFTYIGMTKQEIKVSEKKMLRVNLEEDASILDEVVVVGYGIQKKAHLTGSVVAVNSKELLKSSSSNISQALVGRLPGLITQQPAGGPGNDNVNILVRGRSTYQSGDGPLMLVDGVERPMLNIDPNDVESVTVLKDASASVYGMKGAGGVILVTTKRGYEGKTTINYKGSATLSHMTTLPKFMNGTQYMQWYNLARNLDGLLPYFTDEEISMTCNGDPTDGFENTNWQEPLYKTTLQHQHNLSISGGSKQTNYFISGGLMKQSGFIEGHNLQRGNIRSNIDTKPIKGMVVSLNIGTRVDDMNISGTHPYGNQTGNNVVASLLAAAPFVPKEYKGYPTAGQRNGDNPEFGAKNSGFDNSRTLKLETSAQIDYTLPFLEGLKASMFTSWDWQDYATKKMAYPYKVMRYYPHTKSYDYEYTDSMRKGGILVQSDNKAQQLMLRPSISYSATFNKHAVSALFLYEQTTRKYTDFSANRTDFTLYDIPELDFGSVIHPSDGNHGGFSKGVYAGYVGRLNYAYADKYLAEVTFRYDGTYKFAKGKRWGVFPSLSLGWMMSEENFFKSLLPQVEYFKLRASYGILGNDNVDAFLHRKQFGLRGNAVAFGSAPSTGSTLYNRVSYPMDYLTWEKCRIVNTGFELNAWKGLLGIEFDVFYKYTYDILRDIAGAYPSSLGGHYPTKENSGAFDNKGFELILRHNNRVGQVNYGLNANVSFARNRILRITQADNIPMWQNKLGRSVDTLWGFKSMGLYQTQEQLDNAPKSSYSTPELGDIRYVDIDGDGKLTDYDRVAIAHSTTPEMMFSFSGDLSWKGIDFSFQLQGAALCDKMLSHRWNNDAEDNTPLTRPWYGGWDNAPVYLVEGAWRPDNTNAEYPRLSTQVITNNALASDFWKRDGAYVRLKNVVLGYTLPNKWTKKTLIENMRVYVSGNNLLTLTDFKYLDPESPNVVQGYYPQQRTFVFGIDLSF